jgi:hypothetical protein
MKRKSESGQALVFAALALVALTGIAGLGIDMGVLRYERRLQQSAADAAAIAGASNLSYGGVAAGSQAAAASNGFTGATLVTNDTCPATVTALTVVVNNPPQSGPHLNNSKYVEVCVANLQPTYFMRIFGINNETVSARAVATNLSGGTNGGCIYTLGTSGSDISMNGNDKIQAPQCGIIDDGGLSLNGNDTINAGSIGVAGSYSANGNPSVSPAPVTGIPVAADPLAYLTAPTGGACIADPRFNGNGNKVLNPGNYCHGITINGNVNVTFNSGTYILGGNFTPNGNGTLSGTGVTFYITSGTVTLNGNNTFDFSAPTSGSLEGILFWQAAGDTNGLTFNGNNSSKLEGALYAPGASITMNGNNSSALYSIVVAKTLLMNGNNTFTANADYSGLANGSPIKNTILVE